MTGKTGLLWHKVKDLTVSLLTRCGTHDLNSNSVEYDLNLFICCYLYFDRSFIHQGLST